MYYIFLVISVVCASQKISINPENGHFIDSNNNIRIFHGINAVNKASPYYPINNINPEVLTRFGFNVVRLGVFWKAVEPYRGVYNTTYIQVIKDIVKTLNESGIYVIIDNHQDVLSPRFCGEGFPDFVRSDTDILPVAFPVGETIPLNSKGMPDCQLSQLNWQDFYFTEAVNSAFQRIYDNKNGYLDSLGEYWSLLAREFGEFDNVLGYDLFNEPWAGDVYSFPKLMLEYGYADLHNLERKLYSYLSKKIREIDKKTLLFFQPVTWDYLQTGFENPPDDRSVLSYHIYCVDFHNRMNRVEWDICNVTSIDMFYQRRLDISRLKTGGFMTEFGDVSGTLSGSQELGNMTYLADEMQQSWCYWGELDKNGLDRILGRIYPQIVSGKLIKYNTFANTFKMKFIGDGGVTVIFIGITGTITVTPHGIDWWYSHGYMYVKGVGLINVVINSNL